jgi:hypothetical protein
MSICIGLSVSCTVSKMGNAYTKLGELLPDAPTRSARKSSQLRRPTARSSARFAPARMAAAALPGIRIGISSLRMWRALRYPRMRSAIG